MQPLGLYLNTAITTQAGTQPALRLIRLDEINEEGHQAYRQALANVYATLDANQPVRLLYLLDGGPNGVNLYFGVVADDDTHLHEAMKNLRGALEGQLPGINFGAELTAPGVRTWPVGGQQPDCLAPGTDHQVPGAIPSR